MKKYLPLLVVLLSVNCISSYAQVKLGGEIGFHSANVQETNSLPGWDTAAKPYYSSRTAIHFGVNLEIPLTNRLFFQPAIDYTSKGRQFTKNSNVIDSASLDTIYMKNSLSVDYIEMPFYITYKLPLSKNHKNNFFIGAGPYLAFIYSGNWTSQILTQQDTTSQFSTQTNKIEVGNAIGKYKTLDLGINIKTGIEFGSITLSGYLSQGLSNFYSAPYTSTFHHKVEGITLGVWLGKSGKPEHPSKPMLPEKVVVKDSDNDGIPDDKDLCPNVPGVAKYNGCPVPDTDHDGIDDDHDSCKTVPGVARYNGCPVPDTDGDGIDDEHDSCKTVPGVARYHGCPIPDRDHDGVNDEEDKCPDVPGVPENNGCPAIKQEIRQKINYTSKNILFASGSERLSRVSFDALNHLAQLLASHPEFHLTINGFTDNTGTAEGNLLLSRQRANTVKNYLIGKGIPEDRITANGFGQQNPIADNNSPIGKEKNRRVEFKVTTQ
ncbi:MAG TPA: OmpA family protein [Puia sp.]|nr:OmpA family protein [Puia sp.]